MAPHLNAASVATGVTRLARPGDYRTSPCPRAAGDDGPASRIGTGTFLRHHPARAVERRAGTGGEHPIGSARALTDLVRPRASFASTQRRRAVVQELLRPEARILIYEIALCSSRSPRPGALPALSSTRGEPAPCEPLLWLMKPRPTPRAAEHNASSTTSSPGVQQPTAGAHPEEPPELSTLYHHAHRARPLRDRPRRANTPSTRRSLRCRSRHDLRRRAYAVLAPPGIFATAARRHATITSSVPPRAHSPGMRG